MSFFRYPGGKSKIKKNIVKEIINRKMTDGVRYVEPFFGGGSIGIELMTTNIFGCYWINDFDIGISCIWNSVLKYPEMLKSAIMEFSPSVDSFFAMKEQLLDIKFIPEDSLEVVDIGSKKIMIHQTSYSGLGTKSGGPLGGVSQNSKYDISCRWSPNRICKRIDSLHTLLKRSNVLFDACTNLDFEKVIVDDSSETFLYIDPPYYVQGNSLYQHGMSHSDHYRLMNTLKRTKHDWILSYDDCEMIRDMYDWAKITSIDNTYTINIKQNTSSKKRELLITRA